MKKKLLIGIGAIMIFLVAFINVNLANYKNEKSNFVDFKMNTAQAEDPIARCQMWCTPGNCCVIICANGWNYICYGVV